MEKSHAFAKQWLDFYGKEIYVNGKQILKFRKETLYDMDLIDTKLKGYDLLEEIPEEKEVDYGFLKQKGLTVISVGDGHGHRKFYLYDPSLEFPKRTIELTKVPREHRILYNPYTDEFNLWGHKSGEKEKWIKALKKKEVKKKEKTLSNIKDPLAFLNERFKDMFRLKEDEQETRKIKDIPIMITENNLVICIPERDGMSRIGFTGRTRWGKTTGLLGFVSRLKWKFPEQRVGIINDSLGQFYSNAVPTSFQYFRNVISKLGEEVKPLPILNLYVSSPELKGCGKFKKHLEEGIGFRYVFSFLHFLRAYEYFSYGVKPFQLEKTTRYLRRMIPDFNKCSTSKEIKEVMYDKMISGNKKKEENLKSMIFKWTETFETIFGEQFLDANFKKEVLTAPKWTLRSDGESFTDNPFNVCMEAGIIPNLITRYAKKRAWFRNALASILKSVEDLPKKPTWIIADEIGDLYEKGKKKDNMEHALIEVFRQGGAQKIGFAYNTQFYRKLHDDIKGMTSHLFTTLVQDNDERRMIAKNYDLSKTERDDIGRLKQFEFMAISDEGWKVYDRSGCRIKEEEDTICFKGHIIPPLSEQSKPGDIG